MGATQGDEKGVSWNVEPNGPLDQCRVDRVLSWIMQRGITVSLRPPGR